MVGMDDLGLSCRPFSNCNPQIPRLLLTLDVLNFEFLLFLSLTAFGTAAEREARIHPTARLATLAFGVWRTCQTANPNLRETLSREDE